MQPGRGSTGWCPFRCRGEAALLSFPNNCSLGDAGRADQATPDRGRGQRPVQLPWLRGDQHARHRPGPRPPGRQPLLPHPLQGGGAGGDRRGGGRGVPRRRAAGGRTAGPGGRAPAGDGRGPRPGGHRGPRAGQGVPVRVDLPRRGAAGRHRPVPVRLPGLLRAGGGRGGGLGRAGRARPQAGRRLHPLGHERDRPLVPAGRAARPRRPGRALRRALPGRAPGTAEETDAGGRNQAGRWQGERQ